MFRRKFIQRLTVAAASGAVTAGALSATASASVIFKIKGFSCPTCAVGLDTLLSQTRGVVRSKSSYPDATSTVEFHPETITVAKLIALIGDMGFVAEEVRKR